MVYSQVFINLFQVQDGISGSVLSLYRQAASLRRESAFQNSNIRFGICNDIVFSFIRFDNNLETIFLIITNLGETKSTDDHSIELDDNVYKKGVVEVSNYFDYGQIIDLNIISIDVGQFVVFKLQKLDIIDDGEL